MLPEKREQSTVHFKLLQHAQMQKHPHLQGELSEVRVCAVNNLLVRCFKKLICSNVFWLYLYAPVAQQR